MAFFAVNMTCGPNDPKNTTAVSKNGLFEPFIYKNERFTKTGSGQT